MKVIWVIEVPEGPLCWTGRNEPPYPNSCEYFDNEGGHAHCELGFYNYYDKKTGEYIKGNKCKALTKQE